MRLISTFPALALLAMALPAQRGNNTEVWEHLRTQYDADGDGKITPEEHGRGDAQFSNLDRNRDGVITEADFARGGRRAGGRRGGGRGMGGRGMGGRGAGGRGMGGRGRGGGMGPDGDAVMSSTARNLGQMYGTFLNLDGNPGLSRDEWQALIDRLEPNAEGVIDAANIAGLTGLAGQGGMARMGGNISSVLDHDRDGTVTEADMHAVFAAMDRNGDGLVEQGVEIDMPPGVGEMAPDFTLPFAEQGGEELTLSSFRGDKPVALIFGSYT